MFGNTTTTKKRRLARSLEHAAKPERLYIGRGPRYLVHPEVAVACAPSLRAIAAALRDETVAFDGEQFRAIRSFVNDGSSTFFGRDATAAMRDAVVLQHTVLGPKPVGGGTGEVATASAPKRVGSPALTGSVLSLIVAAAVALAIAVPAGFGGMQLSAPPAASMATYGRMPDDNLGAREHATSVPVVLVYRGIHKRPEQSAPIASPDITGTGSEGWLVDSYAILAAVGVVLALVFGLLLLVRSWSSRPVAR